MVLVGLRDSKWRRIDFAFGPTHGRPIVEQGAARVPKQVKTAQSGESTAEAETEAAPAAAGVEAEAAQQLDPEIARKIAQVRSQVRESFGKVVMAMMMLPRYRNQTVADLQHLVLEPLIRDRVAIAYPGGTEDDALADITGLAIWASVSEEADSRIREQIRSGTFPLRLKAEDWTSGDINWLIDVIAPDAKTTARVIANFKQVVKEGNLRLHPLITRLVDEEPERMGQSACPAGSSGQRLHERQRQLIGSKYAKMLPSACRGGIAFKRIEGTTHCGASSLSSSRLKRAPKCAVLYSPAFRPRG